MVCIPCKEIIDNGLTAIAADLFAAHVEPTSHLAASAARSLAMTARAANEMYDVARKSNVVNMSGGFAWAGCHKATQIMAWIKDMDDVPVDSVVQKLVAWRSEILVDMAYLVAGGR